MYFVHPYKIRSSNGSQDTDFMDYFLLFYQNLHFWSVSVACASYIYE